VFHAAWINGETGVMQLWHTSFRVAPALATEVRSRETGGPDKPPASETAPPGMEDVTRDIRFVVTKTHLDFTKRTYTITVAVENRSSRPLSGPLQAVMRHFLDAEDNGLGLRNLAIANADGGGAGIGATWGFEVSGGVLAPGAKSTPRILRFTFEGGVPEFPEGFLSPGFRVYARGNR
jgi:hypothetical protein